jgi:hypothetical protein
MTTDDITRLAREAGLESKLVKVHHTNTGRVRVDNSSSENKIERFFRLAHAAGVAEERDRWSRLLEDRAAACERAAENTDDRTHNMIARTLMSVREEGLK